MASINPQLLLAGFALAILGGFGVTMLFTPIPTPNQQSITFILGALAGALTMQGVGRASPSPPAGETGSLKDPIT